MMRTFTIKGRLPSLNELIDANRVNPYKGATIKKTTDELVIWYAKASGIEPITKRCDVTFLWVEANRRRDPDNIASGCKFVFDALQKCKLLPGDGHKWIRSIDHRFAFDPTNPRVVVRFEDV